MIGTRRRPDERRIQHVRLDKLTPHPLNEKLYGSTKPDQNLIDSIRMLGIIEPLIVTQRGQIISGHSRWQAAKVICAEDGVGEKTVYLMTMRPDHTPNDAWYTDNDRAKEEDDNPLLLEKFLIESNRQRVKTPEQIGREFTALKRIEGELAKQRQATLNNKGIDGGNISPSETGKARDKAAAAVGLSGRTAEKLEKVVEAADAGDAVARVELDALNSGTSKSVTAAYQAVVNPVACVCPDCGQSFPSRNQLRKHGKSEHNIASTGIAAFLHRAKIGDPTLSANTKPAPVEIEPSILPGETPTPVPSLPAEPEAESTRRVHQLLTKMRVILPYSGDGCEHVAVQTLEDLCDANFARTVSLDSLRSVVFDLKLLVKHCNFYLEKIESGGYDFQSPHTSATLEEIVEANFQQYVAELGWAKKFIPKATK